MTLLWYVLASILLFTPFALMMVLCYACEQCDVHVRSLDI